MPFIPKIRPRQDPQASRCSTSPLKNGSPHIVGMLALWSLPKRNMRPRWGIRLLLWYTKLLLWLIGTPGSAFVACLAH